VAHSTDSAAAGVISRRAAYPFYKLACRCPRSLCWKELRGVYPDRARAEAAARAPGRYRVTEVRGPGAFVYVGEFLRP
jgi:hypothetical protein